MKVAITGHTGGLGTELTKQYTEKNYQVVGFSKSNGFNLNSSVLFKQVVEQAAECDIVINNADGAFQRDLFVSLLQHNKTCKVIVNISSFASRWGPARASLYASDKAALDSITYSHQTFGPRWPAALLIRPSYFTGKRSMTKPQPHVEVTDVARIIIDVADKAFFDTYRIQEITIIK